MSRTLAALALVGFTAVTACRPRPSDERTYPLRGQVLAVAPDRQLATIKHEAIEGLMPAMTMPYRMKDPKALEGIAPGDLVSGTLVIVSNDAYVTTIMKTGTAPVAQPPAEAPAPASSGFELLKPGEAVPNARLVDQTGKARDFATFKGSTLVVTFIYTKCPLPTFCPLMDRHFATIQTALENDASLNRVHLISISFDPVTDTPTVLRAHARALNADPARWTFFTGDRDDIDRFASRFGVAVSRALNDERDITHNLRTAIIDPEGRLVKVYMGNEWTPARVLQDVRAVVGAGQGDKDSAPKARG